MKLNLEIPWENWHPTIWWGDPGGTTGWAYYTQGMFWGGQLGPGEHHLGLWNEFVRTQGAVEILNLGDFIIGMEGFEFRQNTGNPEEDRKGLELISKEYIGIAKLFCRLHDNAYYAEQNAAAGKGFITNRKLERLGLFEAHGAATNPNVKHMWDAVRHLLHYMTVTLKIRDGLVDKMRRPRE